VEASNFQLKWDVRTAEETCEPAPFESVKLDWSAESMSVFDPCSLVAQVAQSEFKKLFVNEMGLLLYTRGNPILWFSAHRVSGSDQDFLYAWLE
jgi:hypothetical protein